MDKSVQAVRGIIMMGSSTLLTIVLSFVSVTVAARVISEERFGLYFLILALVYLMEVLASFGLSLSAAKFIAGASDEQERETIANTIITFRVIVVLGTVLIIVIGSPVIRLLLPENLTLELMLLGLVMFSARIVENTLAHVMQGFHLYRKMAMIQTTTSLLNAGLGLGFILILSMDIEGLLLAWIISLSIASAARYAMLPMQKRLTWDRDLARQIFRFGLPLQGNDILTFIFQKVDVLILGALMGPTPIAYLEVASRIPFNVERLYQVLNAVYLPYMSDVFAHGNRREAEETLNYVLRVTFFVTLLGTLCVWLFQDEIIVTIFSDKYSSSAPALGLLMISVSIGVANMILDVGLIAKGRSIYMPVVSVIDTSVVVSANFVFISLFGFIGAVYAKLLANIISNFASAYFLYREQVKVQMGQYLKTATFLLGCIAVNFAVGDSSILLRVGLVMAFVGLCFGSSIVKIGDLIALFNSIRYRQVQRPVA